MMKKIGLIAGGGQFPIIFSKTARSKGFSVHALAHINQTDPDLENHVDGIKWIHLGQLKRLVAYFKSCHVKEAVMMGTIIKPNLFEEMRPDELAVSIISGMKHTHDDAILRALADGDSCDGGMLDKTRTVGSRAGGYQPGVGPGKRDRRARYRSVHCDCRRIGYGD